MMNHPARTVVEIVEGSSDDEEDDNDEEEKVEEEDSNDPPEDGDGRDQEGDKDADDDTYTSTSDFLPDSLKARRVAEEAFLTALARDTLVVGERVEVCSCNRAIFFISSTPSYL